MAGQRKIQIYGLVTKRGSGVFIRSSFSTKLHHFNACMNQHQDLSIGKCRIDEEKTLYYFGDSHN